MREIGDLAPNRDSGECGIVLNVMLDLPRQFMHCVEHVDRWLPDWHKSVQSAG